MSALQTILSKAESIEFNRRKVVGLQYGRNEIVFRNETVTKNPWKMTVKIPAYLPYNSTNRALIEAIDYLDRRNSEVITLSSTGLNWLLAYQGSSLMTQTRLDALTVASFSGNQLRLNGLPDVTNNFPSSTVIFRAGDIIQVNGYPYPYTVVEDVVRGNDTSITITTHRPNILSVDPASLNGLGVKVGNAVSFNMICTNTPTYTIVPGRYIVFNDNFQLYENVGAA